MIRLLPIAFAFSLAIIGSSVTIAQGQTKPCPPGLDKLVNNCVPPGLTELCPPGLEKQNGACMPPGLYKRYTINSPLPSGVPYQLITDLQYYGLDRPNGQWLYYLVDGEVLRIADASFIVLEALGFLGN